MSHNSLNSTTALLYLRAVELCKKAPFPWILSSFVHPLNRILIPFNSPSFCRHFVSHVLGHSYFNMRNLLFHFALLFCFSSPSLCSPDDYQNIEKVAAQYSILIDRLNFAALDTVFTSNATFNFHNPKVPLLHGIEAIERTLAALAPPGTVSQHTVSTHSISLSGSDRKTDGGAASTAQALSYTVATYFGTGNLTGQILTYYGKFDDTLVKTSLPGNGGWRIDTRDLGFFVSVQLFFFIVASFIALRYEIC